MDAPKSSKAGVVFLLLFGGVFAAAGIFAGVAMAPEALRSGTSEEKLVAILIPLLFTGVGLGVVWLGLFGKRMANEEAQLRARYPSEPWMWKKEWAARRIPGGGKAAMIGFWAFAAIWNAVSMPLAWKLPTAAAEEGLLAAGMVLLFPLVGCGLLIAALRATLRWRKFGVAFFEPKTLPGVIGGKLEGLIHTSTRLVPEEGISLRLLCINRVTSGSGKNRSTSEHIRWESERRIEGDQLQMGPRGSAIPVDFTIPFDCQPSDDENSTNEILWRIEVKAALPGIDFSKQFVVPVFKTSESSAEVALDDEAIPALIDPGLPPERLPLSKVRVQRTPEGELSLWFGPARNISAALGLSLFTLVWTGISVGLGYSDAPLLFPIVFGGFAVLMWLAVTGMWLGTSHITARSGELSVKRGLLGLGRRDVIPAEGIERIEEAIGVQAGNKVYYQLKLHRKAGGTRTLAGGIGDKREARAICASLEETLQG